MNPANIPRNLERLRTGADMTRTDLAARLGVSRQFVTNIENGSKSPSVARLCELCEALECSPSDLLLPWSEPA